MVRDMTKGKPLSVIMGFCIPMLLGNVFQQFYNMADTLIVGRLIGKGALAAVGSTGSLNFLVMGFITGICNGFCISVSQRFGAGDIKEMRRFAANAVYLCAFFSVFLTALTMVFTRQLLNLIDTPDEIINYAYSYIIVIFAGITTTMAYNLLACLLRALGDSKSPLYFLAVASVINVVLDLFFIIVLDMGVMGAGVATVIAQAVSALLCFIYIRRNFPILVFTKDDLKFSAAHSAKLILMGVPMGLQFSITAVGSLILQKAINGLGTVAIASITTGNKISLLFFQPMETLGITMATYCGQNLGGNKFHRIQSGIRVSMMVQIAYSFAAGAVLWFFGQYIARLFVGGAETEIIANAHFQLRVLGATYITLAVLFIMRSALQGMGYSIMAMFAGACELAGRVIAAFVLVEHFGFKGVCFAGPLSWLLADMVLIPVYFMAMRKIKKKTTIAATDKTGIF